MTVQDDFLSAIRQHGLTPPQRLLCDGKIHRFRSGPERAENGFYRLMIVPAHDSGDIGFGLIGCWKRAVNEKWCSREPKSVSVQDRKAMERAREAQRAEDAKLAREAAEKAASIWKAGKAADVSHPYLVAKKIGARGIRQYKDALVVPVYRNGKLTSLQFIAPDGTKRFLSNGQVDGGYASISAGPGRGRIVIAEGFATAASLHEALGVPIVVGFNAGNLMAVAKAIKDKYPEAEILIAADNDRFTVVRGKPVNVGIERANEAAAAIGARVVAPEFPPDDPEKLTDWNDFAVRYGTDTTRQAFEAAAAVKPEAADAVMTVQPERVPEEHIQQPPDDPVPADWRQRLIPGKQVAEGHPFPFDGKSKTNAYLFLKYHHRFAGLLCYNEFTDAVMLARCPPWGERNFSPLPIRDDDFFMLSAQLEYCDITITTATAADAAVRVAKENSINPPREFLSRLVWDRRPRLDSWLTYFLGADEQPAQYLALVGAKWLVGAVSRVFEPGCKFDTVMILEGSQGIGKSMALRSLATFGGQDFFLDSVGDIRSKDTLMTMQGKLIVEIAELASFKKSENEEIKAFISRQVDEYRPPYGRTVVKRPRFFVLAASTNEVDDGIFTDETGNRRYWPVKCGSIDAEALRDAAPQLWAEAVQRYRSGERTWLSRDEFGFAEREQAQRLVEDAWKERVAGIVKHEWTGVRIDQVLDKLELKPRDINNIVRKRVKNSLRQLGWVETRRGGEGRVWRQAGQERAEA